MTPQHMSRKMRDPDNLEIPIASIVGGDLGIDGAGIGSAGNECSGAEGVVTKTSLGEVCCSWRSLPNMFSVLL